MASQRVAVVADSTLALPPEMAARAGIVVVPVHVVVDGKSLREGVDITPTEVAQRLRGGARLTTSRPSPHEFATAYRAAADAGAQAVVSVHLSAELSGTAQAARAGAATRPIPVQVVDTRLVAMAGGFAALDAAAACAAGADLPTAAAAAERTAAAARLFFYVDTLEYLRRGGRIGAAQRYLGQALRVKPLLSMREGEVIGLEKVRTSRKALNRLVELACEAADDLEHPRIALHHLEAADSVAGVAADLQQRLPGVELTTSEVGAVIGVHTGPGMVAIAVAPGPPT
jgi:DegV family protein with EDD domain